MSFPRIDSLHATADSVKVLESIKVANLSVLHGLSVELLNSVEAEHISVGSRE